MIHTGTQIVHNVTNQVPLQALKQLDRDVVSEEQRLQWFERVRINSIAGCCPKSHARLFGGVRCWGAFAQRVSKLEGQELLPIVYGLLQWSVFGGERENLQELRRVMCARLANCPAFLLMFLTNEKSGELHWQLPKD